jgi:hypothetical protein
MADLYSALSRGGRVKPNAMFIPQLTPVFLDTDGQTLPSGRTAWTDNDTDEDNYLTTSEYQEQRGDIFKAVQAVQEYCEVYEIGGSSDSNYLTVMCRDSSIPYDAGTTFQNEGNTITKLQTAVRAALGGAAVLVKVGRLVDDDTDN